MIKRINVIILTENDLHEAVYHGVKDGGSLFRQ